MQEYEDFLHQNSISVKIDYQRGGGFPTSAQVFSNQVRHASDDL